MKKQLLGTSAIALGIAMASPAAAQDWNMKWGGYFNAHVGVSNVDNSAAQAGQNRDGVDVFNNSEIHFLPSVTLDNGLTFGVNIQMEGTNNGGGATGIDETFMEISGESLGKIILGSENSAGYKSMVGAPGVTTMYINSPSISSFLPLSTGASGPLPWNFRQAGNSSFTEVGGNNDVPRITYFTPSFNGLTLGVSYASSAATNAGNNFALNRNNNISDIYDIGLNYSQTFGTTDVTIGARYGSGTASNAQQAAGLDDPTTWGIGAQVGFSGFKVGGSYTKNDNGQTNVPSGLAAVDQSGWSFGVTYDLAGPWSVEALTYQGTYDNAGTGGSDAEYKAYRIGAARDLGPGVSWNVYYVYAEGNDKGNSANDTQGSLLGTAINLSF